MGGQSSVSLGLVEVQQRLHLTSGQVLRLVEVGQLTMVRAPFGMKFNSEDVERFMEVVPAES